MRPSNQSFPQWPFLVLIAFTTVLHLGSAAIVGLGADETHYALYGQHLAMSYFDHPPMVGWLQASALALSLSDFALRLWPILLWLGSSLLVYKLTLRFYQSELTAFIASALLCLNPMVQLLWYGMVPDTPLIFVCLLAIFTIDDITNNEGSLSQYALLGLWLGLAGLSKYTAFFVAVALILAVLRHQRIDLIITPKFILTLITGAAVVSPVIIWNAQNEWVSLDYQFNHGVEGDWKLSAIPTYLAALLASFGPFAFFMSLAYLFNIKQQRQEADNTHKLALSSCKYIAIAILALAIWSSGNGEILPHWTTISWVLLAPATAHYLVGLFSAPNKKLTKAWAGITAALSIILVSLAFVLLIAPPIKTFPETREAVRDLHGWKESGEKAKALYDELAAAKPHSNTAIWVREWTIASRVAWYAQPAPIQVMSNKLSQFHLWWGGAQESDSAILIDYKIKLGREGKDFEWKGYSCRYLSDYKHTLNTVLINEYFFYQCDKQPRLEADSQEQL